MSSRILVVDDDPQSLDSTARILEYAGYSVATAPDGQEALQRARGERFDVVVSDVRMPHLGGIEFLKALVICGKEVPVILMTAFGQVDEAVWAMKHGAVDFLLKPFKRQSLLAAVEVALRRSHHSENEEVIETQWIGSSDLAKILLQMVDQVAPTDVSVLIQGESGTGKELLARCVHDRSTRSGKPFVPVNCAAIPETLMESEFFGHEKGAFSGATSSKMGLIEAAHHGTLFLDEVGDMPLALQAKLLRVLQEKEIRRVGSTQGKQVDLRVISATHKDLREEVKLGRFREDLLFRLEVVTLSVPPLRERPEDIQKLTYHFLELYSQRHKKQMKGIHPEALGILLGHSWPGNVRELSNVIERGVIFAFHDELVAKDLPMHLSQGLDAKKLSSRTPISIPIGTPLKEVEDLLIRKTLEATEGDKNMAAKLLGVNSRTIYRKLEKNEEEPQPPS